MTLKTKVIVSEITNLSDARYCAGMGVDYIGFRLDEGHEKYIDLKNYQDITGWVAGVEVLGETNQPDSIQAEYEPNSLLIDNIDTLKTYVGDPVYWRISTDRLDDFKTDLIDHKSKIAGLIVDGRDSDDPLVHSGAISKMSEDYDVYLGFGITTDSVDEIVRNLPIKGLALKGGEEIRPGYKDYDLADILELIELED